MDDPSARQAASPRPWRRWRRRGVGVLLLGALATSVFLFLNRRAEREIRAATEEADRLDPHWRLADMEEHREAVPDEENSALVVLKAAALMPPLWPAANPFAHHLERRVLGLPPEVPLVAPLAAELRAELAKANLALAEAHRLHDLPRGRYAATWLPDPLFSPAPYDAGPPAVSTLLCYEAALLADDGDADAALAAARCIVNVGRSLGDDPGPMAHLIRAFVRGRAASAVERALALGQATEAELSVTQRLLEDEASQPLAWRFYRGERAFLHETLLTARSARLGTQMPGLTLNARIKLTLSAGYTRRIHPSLLRLTNEAVEASRLPVGEQKETMARLQEEYAALIKPYPILTGAGLMPRSLFGDGRTFRRNEARLRCVVTALAAERFRLAHGRWPEGLAELVPAYLATEPLDPCDGRPLRFLRLPDGLAIYSVGADETDDGGALNRGGNPERGTDVGFRLWDVPRRRSPPAELLPEPTTSP